MKMGDNETSKVLNIEIHKHQYCTEYFKVLSMTFVGELQWLDVGKFVVLPIQITSSYT
jgi:hypothetical protein